jgi:hypothetical protein
MYTAVDSADEFMMALLSPSIENTQTFRFNFRDNIVGGKINDLEALRQSIYLRLTIEADQYIIYPYTYAIQTVDLIGKPNYYVAAVLEDRIKDTLLQDDRIAEVSDFKFETEGRNKLKVMFVVKSIYGGFDMETVVKF